MQDIDQALKPYQALSEQYNVRFENPEGKDQGAEQFYFDLQGEEKCFHIHDYPSIYKVPMLYDAVLYGKLRCTTPFHIVDVLAEATPKGTSVLDGATALELGAGSGIFGEVLRESFNLRSLTGLDLFPEAKDAAERDRPGLYDDYVVCDLTKMSDAEKAHLTGKNLDMVVVASATGWKNHIPVEGFEQAFQLLEPGGWFVFHVNPHTEDAMSQALVNWVNAKIDRGELTEVSREERPHRRAADGRPIYYDIVVGQKQRQAS